MIIFSHCEELSVNCFFLILLWWKMCHMFPCIMVKPVFPTRDAPIDQRNLFLLSGKAVSSCRHKSFHEKQVLTDRKSNFRILVVCENKLSKAKLYKSNFVKKTTECSYLFIFWNSPYFLVNFFVIPVLFYYIYLLLLFGLNCIFLLKISLSITFNFFFSIHLKPIQNIIRKNSGLEILLHLKISGLC